MRQAFNIRPRRHSRVQARRMQARIGRASGRRIAGLLALCGRVCHEAHAKRATGRRIAYSGLDCVQKNNAIWFASTAGTLPPRTRPRNGNLAGAAAVRLQGRRQAPPQASRLTWRRRRPENGCRVAPALRCARAEPRVTAPLSRMQGRCRYGGTDMCHNAASGYLWPGIGAVARSWQPRVERGRGAHTAAQGTLMPASGRGSS